MFRDLPHAVAVGAADRDLFALSEAQVAAGIGLEARRWHAASLTKPARANRGRHTGTGASILTGCPLGNRLPEPLPMLPPRNRRTSRRPHRRPPRRHRCPTSCPSHAHTSRSRCCDNHLNSPSTSWAYTGGPGIPAGPVGGKRRRLLRQRHHRIVRSRIQIELIERHGWRTQSNSPTRSSSTSRAGRTGTAATAAWACSNPSSREPTTTRRGMRIQQRDSTEPGAGRRVPTRPRTVQTAD